ncbi:MAG: CoA-transferase subunit beta [Armatimonadota bacterium]|nr:CoA-transferase subunit beta [Armatimonadota bacterium]MDR7450801.1 CoA-transferase subunit beta [Armatimonadota bacterium]MDR7466157.1 CoA-transferase subunit beta [Armatimonadota bacterium]MDR7493806.1 CoA-transferase subunit beta [Armatimonadota bacterium]MDR7499033.1 CoA-transferase subunit beta [Armatimonadota bacterium]
MERAGDYTPSEMMIIAAARALRNDDVCFVGIGAPSAACNLARLTHAPGITLIYESGTIAARPTVLPLSIGDPELCATALTTVPVPEMFAYWLQGGRITLGFLAAAQLDRFGNINTTVIGPYARPKIRLPGAGGAPEIASFCRQVFVIVPHERRAFVERVEFVTTFGFGEGGEHRSRLGLTTAGPALVVTSHCLMRPDPETKELIVTSLHPGVSKEEVMERTGWPVRFAADLEETPRPTAYELSVLRELLKRSAPDAAARS